MIFFRKGRHAFRAPPAGIRMPLENPGQSAQSLFNTGKRFYVSADPADREMARDCFEKAAGLGHAQAQRLLGIMYLEGAGVPKNVGLARQWLTMAMDRGDPIAAFRLAQLHATGLDVEKDWSKAYGLLSLQGM